MSPDLDIGPEKKSGCRHLMRVAPTGGLLPFLGKVAIIGSCCVFEVATHQAPTGDKLTIFGK
eukprot:7364168-Prymnesium_polylepis.1